MNLSAKVVFLIKNSRGEKESNVIKVMITSKMRKAGMSSERRRTSLRPEHITSSDPSLNYFLGRGETTTKRKKTKQKIRKLFEPVCWMT